MIAGTACISTDSKYERWIQTQGFQKWSKNNCGYLFTSTFLTECSIIKTNGIEEGIEHDNETLQINDASNNNTFYFVNKYLKRIPRVNKGLHFFLFHYLFSQCEVWPI